ncbi:ArnT family glycosyltransferase [Sediminicola arcticus]|uniref:Glycosyltransferase family 39 protein n=1 Tax=Sediminicola arcticus TaxID=1574308 RepID=A0ABV2SPZ3_9FLAO
MIPKLPKTLLYLLIALFAINMAQSYFTELIFDEAYYWYYAQNMAWGYFDHPPMVALMIKLSSFFFNDELGVRFVSCLLSVATFLILWQLIDHPKKERYGVQFFVLVFSMTLINAYGFFTLPDTPFLFFTALFLLVYKKFINKPSVLLALGLGIVMAALMYSKYHAVLVIIFTLLSNMKLVFNKYAWLSVVVALICYTPHFLWLYENEFVSIKYHLYERPNRAYEFGDFTLGYFVNLVALFGLTFPWIYKSLFKTRAKDQFTKALLYLTYGVLVFFFVSSFNRRIQTQWIIVISIPMAIMAFNYLLENENAKKWIYRMGMANIAILLFLRVGLIYEPLFPIVYETHGNSKWVSEIKSQIGDMSVVFENSYRNAPMYAFYSGSETYSLNNIMYRQNQYSIDNSESKIQHKKILYVSKYTDNGDISFQWADGTKSYGNFIDNFESFRKLRSYVTEKDIKIKEDKELTLKVFNPYEMNIPLEKIKLGIAYLNDYRQVMETLPLLTTQRGEKTVFIKAKDTTRFIFKLPKSKMEDPGFFKITISENGLYMGINGDNIKLD